MFFTLDRVQRFSDHMLRIYAHIARAHVFCDVVLKDVYIFLKLSHSISNYSGFPVLRTDPLTVRLQCLGIKPTTFQPPEPRFQKAHFGVACRAEKVKKNCKVERWKVL